MLWSFKGNFTMNVSHKANMKSCELVGMLTCSVYKIFSPFSLLIKKKTKGKKKLYISL